MLEDRQQYEEVYASEEAFHADDEEWIEVVPIEQLLLCNELSTSKALRNYEHNNAKNGRPRLLFLGIIGILLTGRNTRVADERNTRHNKNKRNDMVRILLTFQKDD